MSPKVDAEDASLIAVLSQIATEIANADNFSTLKDVVESLQAIVFVLDEIKNTMI